MTLKINNITIEKLSRHSKPTQHDPHMKRYTIYLDNGEVHAAITPLKPTVEEGHKILNGLLNKALLGSVNERKVVK